jgi:hypothetical protein
LPLEAAEVRNEEGQPKPECELNAGKRVVKRLRAEHRQLKLCILGAELYAPEPFLLELRQLRMGLVRVAKPTSHAGRFERVDALEQRGECVRGTWEEGAACNRRSFEYRIAAQVPLTHGGKVRVNFVAVGERPTGGQGRSHNSWVTDFAVTRENGAMISGMGRSRWQLENAQCNVPKHHG